MPYTCDLKGNCLYHHWDGNYPTLEECQANCRGLATQEDLELAYIIGGYDWNLVDQMSDNEKREVLKREFRISLPPEEAKDLVYYLATDNFEKLLQSYPQYPLLQAYAERHLDDLDYLLLEARSICSSHLEEYKEYRKKFSRSARNIITAYHRGNYNIDSAIHNLTVASVIGTQRYQTTCNLDRDYDKVERLMEGYFPFLEDLYS